MCCPVPLKTPEPRCAWHEYYRGCCTSPTSVWHSKHQFVFLTFSAIVALAPYTACAGGLNLWMHRASSAVTVAAGRRIHCRP